MTEESLFVRAETNSYYRNAWIRYAFEDQHVARLMIEGKTNDDQFIEFLSVVLKEVPDESDYLDTKWRILSKVIQFKGDSSTFSTDLAIQELVALKDPILSNVVPFLIENESLSDEVARNLCFFLLTLRNMRPGIFYSLSEKIQGLLELITMERALPAIGPEVFSFMTTPNMQFFEKWSIDVPAMAGLFGFPIVYAVPDLCKLLQSKCVSQTRYPHSFLGNEDLSLANEAVLRGIHFFDIYAKEIENYLIVGEFSHIPAHLKKYPDVLGYFMVVHQQILYSDLANTQDLLNSLDWSGTVAAETIARMKNDHFLLQNMCFITDTEIPPREFTRKSLPFMLKYALGNSQLILEWADMQYLMISDADAIADFDFLRAYKAIQLFLGCFRRPGKQLQQSLESIRNIINSIRNKAVQSYVIIDIFSCIFIKGKDDMYLCDHQVARAVCRLLSEYNVSPFITGGYEILRNTGKKVCTLESFFVADHGRIYQAISEQKWDLANHVTAYLPYFRRLYTRAHAAHCILNEVILPEELKTEANRVAMDVILSTQNRLVWPKVGDVRPHFRDLIRRRELNSTAESVLSVESECAQWRLVADSVHTMERDPLEFIAAETRKHAHLTKIVISRNVMKFVNTLILYFQSRSLDGSDFDKDFGNMFKFDITRTLAGPFNISDFTRASQLAQLYHLKLFEVVVKHRSAFNVTEEYLKANFEEYPLECAALAYTNNMYHVIEFHAELLSPRLLIYINRIMNPVKKEKPSDTKINKILELVAKERPQEIDDYIFDCDLYDLYTKLLKLNNYSDAMIHALDICSFTARTEAELEQERQIRFTRKLRAFSQSSHPRQIIADLMKSNQFDMCIDYIQNFISQDSCGPAIYELFSLCTNDGNRIECILNTFPERYDLLSSRFFHVQEVVPHLLKSCPLDKREQIGALSMLPEEIALDSNIFDISTVVASFGRHPNCIYRIDHRTSMLFTDAQLLTIIESASSKPDFYAMFMHVHAFFRDKSIITSWWVEQTITTIRQMSITSCEDEEKYIKFFNKIEPVMGLFRTHREVLRFMCIRDLLEMRTFLRYKCTYSFEDYGSSVLAEALLAICDRYDYEGLAKQIGNAFAVDISIFMLHRMELMLREGIYESAKGLFKTPDKPVIDYNQDRNFKCLTPIMKIPEFDHETIAQLVSGVPYARDAVDIPTLYIYQDIRMTKNFVSSKERDSTLGCIITHGVSNSTAMSILVAKKQYAIAYQLLMGIEDPSERAAAFVHSFYCTAISHDPNPNDFEKFIKRQDPTFVITGPLWDALAQFCRDMNMMHTLYRQALLRNHLEEAAYTALALFDTDPNQRRKSAHLTHAIYCLKESRHARKHPGYVTFLPLPTETRESLKNTMKMAELMQDALQFCEENELEFTSNHNIMKGEAAAVSLGALFLIYGEESLFNRLCQLVPVQQCDVTSEACLTLSGLPLPDLLAFLNNMKQRDPALSKQLSRSLLKSLVMIDRTSCVITLIANCFDDPVEQCHLFLEYDYVVEAFSTALACNAFNLLPAIAYRASQIGNAEIVQTCYTLLL